MATIAVSVAWATPTTQDIVTVDVPSGAHARVAIERSGLVTAYGLDLAQLGVAIHGRKWATRRLLQRRYRALWNFATARL